MRPTSLSFPPCGFPDTGIGCRAGSLYQKLPFDALFFLRKLLFAMSSLENPVLVLNRLWQPVHICRVRRALGLLFVDHAHVVDTDEASCHRAHDLASWMEVSRNHNGPDVVHSVSRRFREPAVIVLRQFDRLPLKEIRFSRQSVFERDRFTCQYCGKGFETSELNLDHVIPRDKGGKTTWENVVCSCIRCNTRKANKLPAQAGMFPLTEPKRPRWRPFFDPRATGARAHASWMPFISGLTGEMMASG
jgi:5-methylcytosine-specific restriction endonuclease McrA